MAGFSLPETSATNHAAFRNADGAAAWLAAQPQANVPAMLSALQAQIDAFNQFRVAPRERFKTLDVLRKAVFTVCNDCRKRFENKPLPLSAPEQTMLDAVRRLCRILAVGYQHCLQACIDGDTALSPRAARVAHRVMFCLRLEQLHAYAAGSEPLPGFWKNAHVVLLAAERLGVAAEPVEERLLAETSESTVTGQYAMAVMLHLARPFSLSGGQFAAVVRWLARWREQASIVDRPETDARACCIALDLSEDRPLHVGAGAAYLPRWLSLGGVLRKIRRRIASLDAGETPENLKLGSGLTAEACRALLEALGRNLREPPTQLPDNPDKLAKLDVGTGLVNLFHLLGGDGLEDALRPASATDSSLSKDQLAVFGHVVRERKAPEATLEHWRLVRQEGHELVLLRPHGAAASRLSLRGLLAVRQKDRWALAVITSLEQRGDGGLCAVADPLAGEALPRVAEIRDRTTGQTARHPVFQLLAGEGARGALLVPAGVMARASAVRFLDTEGRPLPGLRLADCAERGTDVDVWRLSEG